MIRFIKHVFFYIYISLVLIMMGVFSLPLLCAPSSWSLFALRIVASQILWAAGFFLDSYYQIIGSLPSEPVIIACKHESVWETMVLMSYVDKPVFVLKHSLLMIPFLGWLLRKASMISVKRQSDRISVRLKNPTSLLLSFAQKSLKEKNNIIIFPEGTRTIPGTKSTYKSGVYRLYQHLGIPVIPVALNSGSFWHKHSFFKNPGMITLTFLPPIPPHMNKADFMHLLSETIEAKSADLRAQLVCNT